MEQCPRGLQKNEQAMFSGAHIDLQGGVGTTVLGLDRGNGYLKALLPELLARSRH